MTMSTTGTRANGLEAARADQRRDGGHYRALFRAVVQEATDLQDLGERLRALELTEAYQSACRAEVEA
jgi:hypothetical protein